MNVVALSMRQPWCYAVTDLGKRVENRKWNTSHRGRFLIHASKARGRLDEARYREAAIAQMLGLGVIASPDEVPPDELLPRGGFVASATLLDVIPRQSDPAWARERFDRHDLRWWFESQYGFVLERVEKLQGGVLYPGALNFFRVPDPVVRQTGAFVL
jgi:hypothetical protein